MAVVLGVGAVVLMEEIETGVLWVHEDELGLLLVFVDCLEAGHHVVVTYGYLDHFGLYYVTVGFLFDLI